MSDLQADAEDCCLVVTTGGTGPSLRDVTPEATASVCDKMMPGYGEQMRAISLKYVPTAVLSRQTAGIRYRTTNDGAKSGTLIINLPGKPKSIRETFDEVFKSIPYCIDLIGGPYIETVESVVAAGVTVAAIVAWIGVARFVALGAVMHTKYGVAVTTAAPVAVKVLAVSSNSSCTHHDGALQGIKP